MLITVQTQGRLATRTRAKEVDQGLRKTMKATSGRILKQLLMLVDCTQSMNLSPRALRHNKQRKSPSIRRKKGRLRSQRITTRSRMTKEERSQVYRKT